jgi:cell division protein ZipA
MDMLRWVLLLLGVVVVIAIYFYTSQQRLRQAIRRDPHDEPELDGISLNASDEEPAVHELQDELINLDALLRDEIEAQAEQAPAQEKPEKKKAAKSKKKKPETPPSKPEPEMFVVLHVASRLPDTFRGSDVLRALRDSGLEFGEMNIFHRLRHIGGKDRSLYSVANMVKPGTLMPDELTDDAQLPGLSLFMRLPSVIPGEECYNDMLHCTHRLAELLDGKILDETRSILTQQAMEKILEDIRLFELKPRSA